MLRHTFQFYKFNFFRILKNFIFFLDYFSAVHVTTMPKDDLSIEELLPKLTVKYLYVI